MRILHAINSMNPADGGPVEGINQLASVNRKDGHLVEVVCMDDPQAPWLQNIETTVHAIGSWYLKSYRFSPAFYQWLVKNARNYDCVVVNGIWGFNAFGTWLALHNARTPYVVFTHGMLDPWFNQTYPLKRLKKMVYWPWGLYPVLRDAAAVVFTCEMERQLARKSFKPYKCNEVVIRYGTGGIPDVHHDYRPAFFKANPGLEGKRLFLFLGRVAPKKGPDLLIRSVSALRKTGKWDPTTMRLVMAGPTNSDYATELKQLIEQEAIQEFVCWTGMILGDEKWGAIQAAEAFVLPSHQENFGISVAEALSAGTPVLITHPVNISPEIGNDRAGLVDEDTQQGCEALLSRWLELAPDRQQQMRRQARITFENRYTSQVGAHDLIEAIVKLIRK